MKGIMKLLDLTIGFNEIDLFRIRYHELKDLVDKFIIVEATHTHSGNPKPLYFSEWKNRLGDDDIDADIDWDKIDIFVWDNKDFPNTNAGAWLRENLQRELLLEATQEYSDDTWAMLSDMDEIPARSAVAWAVDQIKDDKLSGVWRFEQMLTYLYFNTFAGRWNGTKIFQLSTPRSSHSPKPMTDEIRYRPEEGIAGTIHVGGWHFSSCGGVERVRTKFDSYAHTEMQQVSTESIEDSYNRAVDPFHKYPMQRIEILALPKYVQQCLEYYGKYLYQW